MSFTPTPGTGPFQAAQPIAAGESSTLYNPKIRRLAGRQPNRVIPMVARGSSRPRPLFTGVRSIVGAPASELYSGQAARLYDEAVAELPVEPVQTPWSHAIDDAALARYGHPMPDSGEVMGGVWTPEAPPSQQAGSRLPSKRARLGPRRRLGL